MALWLRQQQQNQMEAFRSLARAPKGVESVYYDIPHCDSIQEYRTNLKLFIKTVTAEVADIIHHYQTRIAVLQAQNKKLKGHKIPSNPASQQSEHRHTAYNLEPPSVGTVPLSKKKAQGGRVVADSHLFNHFTHEMEDNIKFSAILRKHEGNQTGINLMEMEEESPAGRSHFQAKNNRRKQHEADLVRFLEQGSKSMNTTTQRYLQTIGRNKKQSQNERLQENIPQEDSSEPSTPQRKSSIQLNHSLSNIFSSLDNSYVAKRSKSQKKDRPSTQLLQATRQKNEQELARIAKSSGVKNLLLRLRENVQFSGKKQPQMIRCSKLITCGPNKSPLKEPSSNRNSSKVLINPVPVDIARKSKATKQDTSKEHIQPPSRASSPTKSILKQTSTILSKSIVLPGDSFSDQF